MKFKACKKKKKPTQFPLFSLQGLHQNPGTEPANHLQCVCVFPLQNEALGTRNVLRMMCISIIEARTLKL